MRYQESEFDKRHVAFMKVGAVFGAAVGACFLELSELAPAWKNAISGGSVGVCLGIASGAAAHFICSDDGEPLPSVDRYENSADKIIDTVLGIFR